MWRSERQTPARPPIPPMRTATLFNALIAAAAIGVAVPLHAQEKGKATDKGQSAGKSEGAEKRDEAGKEEDGEKTEKSVTSEPLGQLALGHKPAEVEKVLGKPESKGKKTFQEATGTSVQDWKYPAKGLTITMEFAGKTQTVSIIQATAACTLATARGIKIGSTEAEVRP